MKILMAEYLDWESAFKVGSHHYAGSFLKDGNSLLWLSGYWHPLQLPKTDQVYRRRFNLWKSGGRRPYPNLLTYSPLSLLPFRDYPFFRSPWAAESSLRFTFPQLKGWLRRHNWDSVDILWITSLQYTYLKDMVRHKKLVHRMADLVTGFRGVPSHAVELEKDLIRLADLLIVTAKNLLKRAKQYREDVLYLPNGVDFDHFHNYFGPEPGDLKDIPHPRVIYVGAITHWFDSETVLKAARNLEKFSFIFIGPIETDISALTDLSNAHWLGPRSYDVVPAYLKASDVAVIPFISNSLTNSIHPIKLYEYFAAGLPVVAAYLEETAEINSPAFLAKNANQFTEGILKAVMDPGREATVYRICQG